MGGPRGPELERLLNHLGMPQGKEACWEWSGAVFHKGYGNFGRTGGGNVGAHRLMYELAYGPIPEGLVVLHECDNPPCCRPTHLRLGTQADNLADMTQKGRRVSTPQLGEANGGGGKLTEEKVREIRLSPESPTALAERYGVSRVMIHRVRSRRAWAHVD